jgi:N-acetylmuramoyl-L-alanine amidase
MPIYVVQPGDCLTKIAADRGFPDYKMIYDHPANKELRKLRPNPHVLAPGDKLFIPETVPLTRTLATGQRWTIKIKRPRAALQVYVKDADGEPLSGKSYVLHVEGQDDKQGTTDGDGLVKEDVPAAATTARLEFESEGFSLSLQLGGIDPLRETTGLPARLQNLGFACPTSADAHETEANIKYALARLQAEHGLDATGELDDATRDLLRQAHDRGEDS